MKMRAAAGLPARIATLCRLSRWTAIVKGILMLRKITIVGAVMLAAAVGPAYAAPTLITACGNITAIGSYRLANNLTAAGNCLVLKTGRVTIDLNGFLVSGNGTGAAITDGGVAFARVVIRNGTIMSFSTAIDLSHSQINTVEQVIVSNNTNGIKAGLYAAVKDCLLDANTTNGIVVGKGSIVSGNSVAETTTTAITCGDDCLISGNTASGNTNALGIRGGKASLTVNNVASADYGGINVGDGSGVLGNTASRDPLFGITVFRGSTVAGNTASVDGFAANGEGIQVHEWSLIWGNAASSNKYGFTIYCPSNVLENNATSNSVQDYVFTSSGCSTIQ